MKKFRRMIWLVPETIIENMALITDYNNGCSIIEFHNADLSLMDDQKEQYDWKFATVDAFKDQFKDGRAEQYDCLFMLGYNTEKEAKTGHRNFVDHIKKYGMKFAGSDDLDILRSIATGKWKE
jgi:hypothetical protein